MTLTTDTTWTGTEVTAPPRDTGAAPRQPGRLRRLWRGRDTDAAWVRPALLGLLVATGLLYLVGLSRNGWANGFYAAAVQAGAHSWRAFFFGSFDSSNFITVDKPPASLWVMDISARLFGVNSWSILVPQALEGVATVGLLYVTVRRRFGPLAGLLSGALMALTPVAVLMFRFNNPDALLVLLLVAAAYTLLRAIEDARTRWLVLTGVLIGFGFLTKMLQALLVVPGFALVYLLAAPTSWWRRIRQVLVGGVALVASAAWWVAIVQLWPASSRPYIGGSQNNSILNLIFGYNGFGRLTGNETGSVVPGGGRTGTGGGPGGPGGGMWGQTGITRMFSSEIGGQIAWLLPAALIFLVGMLWLTRRLPRTDVRRAQVLVWGSWLVVTGLTFSYMAGIFHPYYTVALAPPIAALVGIGVASTWRRRELWHLRALLAAALAVTGVWSYVLLDRSPAWHPWLRIAVLVGALVAAAALLAGGRLVRWAAAAVAGVGLLAALGGPAGYALDAASTPASGAIPSAGPRVAGGFGPGGRGGFGGPGGFGPRGGFMPPGVGTGTGQGNAMPGFPGAGGGPGGGGGFGGLLNASTPSSALVRLLQQGASGYTWVGAAVGANSAAGVQLAADEPIMAIGGFNGTDPAPTLAQFEQLVSQHEVHYFLAGGGGGFGGPGGGSGTSSEIRSWVESHFTATTVGGVTVYDLTQPASSSTS